MILVVFMIGSLRTVDIKGSSEMREGSPFFLFWLYVLRLDTRKPYTKDQNLYSRIILLPSLQSW